ncbi:MAG TPA: DUF58 domain-containing protein [Candidatus Kapabacteria bacterium]|nr:DUF58 domain-containing protein [Candidatus Kapabacteria bacterium]
MKSFYLDRRFFVAAGLLVALFLFAFSARFLLLYAQIGLISLGALTILDALILFRMRDGMRAERIVAERLSNGDYNPVSIVVENRYPMSVRATVIDEIPFQFQKRDLEIDISVGSGGSTRVEYSLRPVERGEYRFGAVNVFAASPLGLIRRRYRFAADQMVPVYPSYLQMRRYELLAISNRLSEVGIKRIRRVGHTMEFDQIREYVQGDDYRTVNWKATARASKLMINQFQDEKAQQVYSVIDKGRVMKMPFEGMSLLDYAINTSLVISNIALVKGDKAGLITFSDRLGTMLAADRRRAQMQKVLEVLYNQKTNFHESSFESLYGNIRQRLTTRSLLFLYTNFETLSSLTRQLPYLRAIARDHLLVVVFFENTEMKELLASVPGNTEEVYLKTIAEKFAFEKKLIVKELQRYGITSILTTPSGLTVSTINKYLEIKARRLI